MGSFLLVLSFRCCFVLRCPAHCLVRSAADLPACLFLPHLPVRSTLPCAPLLHCVCLSRRRQQTGLLPDDLFLGKVQKRCTHPSPAPLPPRPMISCSARLWRRRPGARRPFLGEVPGAVRPHLPADGGQDADQPDIHGQHHEEELGANNQRDLGGRGPGKIASRRQRCQLLPAAGRAGGLPWQAERLRAAEERMYLSVAVSTDLIERLNE